MKTASVALLLIVLLTGCAAGPEKVRAPRQEAAAEANQRARKLFLQGDFPAALASAGKAYEAAASVEDEAGVAASLINLSVIYQHLGRREDARRAVDRILTAEGIRFDPLRVAEASMQAAALAMAEGDYSRATVLLDSAADRCGQSCTLTGRLLNIRAELAIRDNRLDEALAAALRGVEINASLGRDEDLATSLRLAANARIHLPSLAGARQHLDLALAIDKRLGLSRQVFRDLLLQGIVAERETDHRSARNYYQRARDVALADRHDDGVREAESRLQAIQKSVKE